LFALGIRFVGQTVAKKLAREFKSVDALSEATIDTLVGVDEIGVRIAESVVEFFDTSYNTQIIERLKEYGLQLEISAEQMEDRSEVLKGLTFVVSGVFEKVSRNELKDLIEKNGGKVASSISSKTSYVVAGDKMGPSKKDKADALGVKIITEDMFLEMV